MSDALIEAVRGLRVADPDLGFKPLLAKLRAQQPDLGAATNSSFEYSLPVCAAVRASRSAVSRSRCCATPPSSCDFRCFLSFL